MPTWGSLVDLGTFRAGAAQYDGLIHLAFGNNVRGPDSLAPAIARESTALMALTALIGQLYTHSTGFRVRWAGGDVRAPRGGTKVFRHPLIGGVRLPYENLHVDGVSGQVLTVFTPSPGSPKPTPSACWPV